MNKLLIVLLAVCLVSVHAFVKRDAPETKKPSDFQTKFNDIAKDIGGKINEAFNPDTLKNNFNELVDKLKNAVDDLKPKENPPK